MLKYRSMYYGNNAYAPKAYRRWLGERMRPLMRAHGLERGREDPVTGGVRSSALAQAAGAVPTRGATGARRAAGEPAAAELPDLFGAPPDPSALF